MSQPHPNFLASSNRPHVLDINHSGANTLVVRNYPCRCGETHAGDYAIEDWNHHNCDHREWLLLPLPDQLPFRDTDECFAVCEECGASGTVHYDEGAITMLVQKVRELEDQLATLKGRIPL
mgnify:CR=1 FL=1